MSRMLEEIREQPAALARTYQNELPKFEKFRQLAQRRNFRLIVLIGRGTSDNAALFGRYLLEINTAIPVSLCAPSIHTLYHAPVRLDGALAVAVSQSGESTDVNVAVEACKQQGAFTIGITNTADSTLARLVDELFLVWAGEELSVPATKTYTGQLLLLYLLAAALAPPTAGMGSPLRLEEISQLPELARRALEKEKEVQSLVDHYRSMQHCSVVARGLNYANAYELALKLMETCYLVAERFSVADFLHGPIAMVERDFPVILFAPPGVTYEGLLDLARRLRAAGADLLAITSEGELAKLANRAILLDEPKEELFTPIPYIIPGQIFAALLAEAKNLNPDAPRSLWKITRTV